MHIIGLRETDSTNNYALRNETEITSPSFVYCHTQTSGRGQRGNSWESEPGKNITGTLFFRPENFLASRQFLISEAICLSIVDFLRRFGIEAKVKWPNDIYVYDKKICGILAEHAVTGKHITRTIVGIGLNLNQDRFLSDAPNPVSVKMLTGETYPTETIIDEFAARLNLCLNELNNENADKIHKEYLAHLWRFDNKTYKFIDHKTDEEITARITEVSSDGVLTLTLNDGTERKYIFKEVEFVL